VITYTTAGSWPSTLRLPGLTTHKPPTYKNLAHQPIKHNYNSFQNMVYNGARPWGHYTYNPFSTHREGTTDVLTCGEKKRK
jgi:hypothetical protein